MKSSFEKIYPFLHLYLSYHGWLELGSDEHYNSWVRVLDEGGMRLECDQKTLYESLEEAEFWAKEWMSDNYKKEVKEAGLH